MFEENGKIQEYVGGYADWLRQGHELTERDNPESAEVRRRRAAERRQQKRPNKLSYKDQRELDRLPAEIAALESTIAGIQQTIAAPDFYASEQNVVQAALQELAVAEADLEGRVERWGELESLKESYQLQD